MNYPLISEYVEAIKAAEDNLDQLKHLRPVLDDDGEPVMTSGNFAVVFKMKDEQSGKLHAVKCFLKEQEGRAEAYQQIAEELEYVSSTFLTPIKYLDKELFVDTNASDDTEFPVLLMDWVEGETLDKYIRKHLDDQYELSLLAYQFSRLAMWLIPQPFAHGDLKPDNILVKSDGTLVLVDYDGMYVPAMKGQKARELGSPDFRHPTRNEHNFNERIDDFPIASILLSLKAISLHPSLLDEYGAPDRLLLSEHDYRNICQSNFLKTFFPSDNIELNIIYSLFLLAYGKVNLTGNIVDALHIIGDNLFHRAQVICHGSRYDLNAKELFMESELPIEPNQGKAYPLFKDLAIRGSADGLRCMGCLLWKEGDGNNEKENLCWYGLTEKNCNDRVIEPLIYRADKLYRGDGVERDYNKAFKMYHFASERNNEYAMMMSTFCYENGFGTAIDNKLALKWSEKISDAKYINQLGQKYYDGVEVTRNYEKALYWYQKAANSGYESAMMMLGFCYENGLGTPVNDKNAYLWYDKILDGNIALSIGLKYFEGEICVNYRKAVKWFNKAIDMGEFSAYPYLAVCYSQGLGVDSKDENYAKHLFNKAKSAGFQGLIDYFFNKSNYELCGSLLCMWILKIQEENEDIEDSIAYGIAVDYKDELKQKGVRVYLSELEDKENKQKIIVQTLISDIKHSPFLEAVKLHKTNSKDWKYGIVKDRWGKYKVGQYWFDGTQLQFDGVICGKNGIYKYGYGQTSKQMIDSDRPKEITMEIFERIISILYNSIDEIIDILDCQPHKERTNKEGSKFFIKHHDIIDVYNIKYVSNNYSFYEGIHISNAIYPDLKIDKTASLYEEIERKYGSTHLEAEVYDRIFQKVLHTKYLMEQMIKYIYNNEKIFYLL
jgi:TPR repeat protein